MASMRSRGVVGVVRSTSSRPAAVATSLTGPVSSKGMSGTNSPTEQILYPEPSAAAYFALGRCLSLACA